MYRVETIINTHLVYAWTVVLVYYDYSGNRATVSVLFFYVLGPSMKIIYQWDLLD